MRALFLLNPKSAKVRKKGFDAIRQLILQIYQQAGIEVAVQAIDFQTLEQDIDAAISQGVSNIFAVGGDGTVNTVGGKLLHKDVNFGIIPLGSGNGLARNLGYSTDLQLAVRQSVSDKVIQMDTGTFGSHVFLNVCGVGLDAEVADMYAHALRRGMFTYGYYMLKAVLGYKAEKYEIWVDGHKETHEEVYALGLVNGTQWGYDAKISPHSYLTDGYFELMVMQKIPFPQLFFELVKLMLGDITQSRYVSHRKCKTLVIKRQHAGVAQVDGEGIQEAETIRCHIQPKSLRIILPNTLTPDKQSSI